MPSARTTASTIQVSKEEHDGPRDAKNALTREKRGLKSDIKKLAHELKGKEAELVADAKPDAVCIGRLRILFKRHGSCRNGFRHQ